MNNLAIQTRGAHSVGDHPAEDTFRAPHLVPSWTGPAPYQREPVGFDEPMGNTGRPISDGAIYSAVSREIERKRRVATTKRGLKIYIAGPMQGIKEFNFPAFYAAQALLEKHGHECFNPAERDKERHGGVDISVGMSGDVAELVEKYGFSLRDALGDDTQWICKHADAIALLPGWENSKGARAEHALAVALGLLIIYLGGFYG